MRHFKTAALLTSLVGAAVFLAPSAGHAAEMEAGKYIYHLAGCEGCHTDKKNKGARLAGGRQFKTDFGTFYSPNITPASHTGIGNWSFADFERAVRNGVSPNGSHYYPAFPYTAYANMSDADLRLLWDYLKTVPAVQQANTAHELSPPFSWRPLVGIWKWLNFERDDLTPDPNRTEAWHRGRYIVTALSHCQECHTPRNALGGLKGDMAFAGTRRNPEGIRIPNITPDRETGIGKWAAGDLDLLFKIGMLPDADFVGGVMAEMVTHATANMSPGDRAAVIEYINAIRPISNRIDDNKGAAGKAVSPEW